MRRREHAPPACSGVRRRNVDWKGNGIIGAEEPIDYIWFSITTAITPGFAGYTPANGIYKIVAGFEAIFGSMLWAVFLATFANKYFRRG
jgi:hypothetical protein